MGRSLFEPGSNAEVHGLKPFLVHCLWPDPGEYPMKRCHWDLEDQEAVRQYKLLCHRVRIARCGSRSVPPHVLVSARNWKQTSVLLARKVHSWGPLRAIVRRIFERSAHVRQDVSLAAALVCSNILALAGEAGGVPLPCGSWAEFEVKPAEVVPAPCSGLVVLFLFQLGFELKLISWNCAFCLFLGQVRGQSSPRLGLERHP